MSDADYSTWLLKQITSSGDNFKTKGICRYFRTDMLYELLEIFDINFQSASFAYKHIMYKVYEIILKNSYPYIRNNSNSILSYDMLHLVVVVFDIVIYRAKPRGC